jgi:hypothetical protein
MVSVATMVSEDQVGRLGYDLIDGLADLEIGYGIWPWFDVELGIAAGLFPSANKPGGLFAPLLILRASPAWQRSRPYVHIDVGPSFTGSLTRALFRAGLGLEFRITESIWLGPTLGYAQLFQANEPGASTDARFLWLGASLSFYPGRRAPARAPVQHTYVNRITVTHDVPMAMPESEL